MQLLSGTAELFGTELSPGQTYIFGGTKAAIFTWQGCSIQVSGDAPEGEYIAEETPMVEYVNVHFALEALREEAKQIGKEGPRVLILGPDDSGKTSLAKTLTGYATRVGNQPLVTNLDPSEGMLSIPGSLSAAAFKTLIDVEEGWGSSPMSGPSAVPVKLPLVYSYTLPDPSAQDGVIYNSVVSKLALAVSGRLAEDPEARSAGLIVDTSGSISNPRGGSASSSYSTIQHIVSEFAISVILILGSERLSSDITRRFHAKPSSKPSSSTGPAAVSSETISVLRLTKSGGCVSRDPNFMKAFRAAQVRAYFFGTPNLSAGISLSPHQTQVDFSTIAVYRLLAAATAASFGSSDHQPQDATDMFLPGGMDFSNDSSHAPGPHTNGGGSSRTIVEGNRTTTSSLYQRLLTPSPQMQNCILTVMNAEPNPPDEEDIRDASVMGFLYVVEVDESRGRMSVLAPVAGRVPERAIVWGGWPEEIVGMV